MSMLVLIDRDVKRGESRHEITVSDRDAARILLKGDLRATADRAWGNAILAQFDSGKDEILAQNGPGLEFVVIYKA